MSETSERLREMVDDEDLDNIKTTAELGAALRLRRVVRGMSMEDVKNVGGPALGTIRGMEVGDRLPQAGTYLRHLKAVGIRDTAAWLEVRDRLASERVYGGGRPRRVPEDDEFRCPDCRRTYRVMRVVVNEE